MYIKETMLLLNRNIPPWFLKAVSTQLNEILISKKGVEYISAAMFDGTSNDSTKTWNTIDVITNLIFDCKKSTSFLPVCQQVVDLLKQKNSPLYERIFVCVTKRMYLDNAALCEQIFIQPVLDLLIRFTNANFKNNEDVADDVKQTVRLLHSLFVERHGEKGVLPIQLLKPLIVVLFRFHTMINSVKSISYDTADLLVKYMKGCSNEEIHLLFDALLFGISSLSDMKNSQFIVNGEKIKVEYSEQSIICTPAENGEVLTELLKNKVELRFRLFAYLLNSLVEDEKYFKNNSRRDLLEQEEHFILEEGIQRKLVVFKLLESLAEEKDIQEHIADNPEEIVCYIETVFKRTVHSELLKNDSSSEGFQSVFTLCMILQLLVESSSPENLKHFQKLIDLLQIMTDHCSDKELKKLLRDVLVHLTNKSQGTSRRTRIEPTEFEIALEEVCDPLLPVRGHGLMTLIELIKKKDKIALERIIYIQNLFKVR